MQSPATSNRRWVSHAERKLCVVVPACAARAVVPVTDDEEEFDDEELDEELDDE